MVQLDDDSQNFTNGKWLEITISMHFKLFGCRVRKFDPVLFDVSEILARKPVDMA